MQIIPHSRHDWLRLFVFPFKATIIISPVLFFVVECIFPHSRRNPLGAAVMPLITALLYSGLILLLTALLFAIFGPKGHALPCVGFAVAAFITVALLLPLLAVA